jgi:electron transfer flavoprotein beta subunit
MVDIVVLIKQMPDLEQVKPDPTTGEPQLKNVPLKLENLSENSVEEAVRLKEKYGGKVTAVIFGNEQSSAIMKKAYAMGADEGYIITGFKGNNPSLTAKVLGEKIKALKHDIVILGNQSADSISGLLGGKIASYLGIPLLGNANSIEVDGSTVKVKRALEENNQVIQANFPVVVSVTQEINEPRLPPVMQIMQAGRKPINTEAATITGREVRIISNKAPKSERKKIIFEDVDKGIAEVAKVLKEEMR